MRERLLPAGPRLGGPRGFGIDARLCSQRTSATSAAYLLFYFLSTAGFIGENIKYTFAIQDMHLQPTPGFHSTMPTLLQLGLSAGSNFLALSLQHCRGCTAGSEITTPCKRDLKALEMRSQGAQKQGHTAPGKTSCATQSAPNISPTLLSIFQNSLQAKIFMPHLNKFKNSKTERGAHLQG